MRTLPSGMQDVIDSGVFTGMNRPAMRCTIQRTRLLTKKFRDEKYASYYWGNPNGVFELPNVQKWSWQRNVTVDAGTLTLTLYNAEEQHLGQKPSEEDFVWNRLGWFTFNRGDDDLNPWNHQPNFWTHRLYPDMLIKTYEGYGYDETVAPEKDSHLLPSGVWLIDQVKLDTTAMITVTCRDATRLLIDQIAFPPVVPMKRYPLFFSHFQSVPSKKQPVTNSLVRWVSLRYDDDSGRPYFGHNGAVNGHRPSDAFAGAGYWLSVGNGSPGADYAYEWIQGKLPDALVGGSTKIGAVRVKTKGGPYRMYVSIHTADSGWIGDGKIPYNPNDPVSAPNGADIPFVKSVIVDANTTNYVRLKDHAFGADKIRVTFHHLWDSHYGKFPYRAAIYDVDVLVNSQSLGSDGSGSTQWMTVGTRYTGDYRDYSDIAKFLLGYAGFFWPHQHSLAFYNTVDGKVKVQPPNPDLVLTGIRAWNDRSHAIAGTDLDTYRSSAHYRPLGDLWADVEQSGTYGPADLTTDIFDKKPLMDGLSYIRDILGFIFYVDETGAAIFRSPNIWSKGNNVYDPATYRLSTAASRQETFLTLRDYQHINSLSATIDSKDQRERIVVANVSGGIGAVTKGIRPYGLPFGRLRRVAIWSDQHFTTEAECQIMADMIAVQQMFAFRTDTVRIAANPAIQVDDQIRLQEPITEESQDLHYVIGITATGDFTQNAYWYDLSTHWLGTETYSKWLFDPANMSAATQGYLRALGKIT